ncbi:MAG TPA: hypothetical protein VFQ39_15050, partial [Longimicrobium sp.]|nr:hypothetical protein [Longimicrobium sp.]
MSLLGFQRAMSALAASPALVRAVRADGEAALAGFELTPMERRRVAAAAAQPGMVINCGLHRSNRITSVLEMLPLTVFLIGGEIRRVADGFWADHPNPDFTTRRELHRFGGWLRARLDDGMLAVPYLREVVAFELAVFDLGMASRKRLHARVAEAEARWPDGPFALHPLTRLVRFRHDPAPLLDRLRARRPLPYDDLPEGEYYLLVDVRAERALHSLAPEWGRVLAALEDGEEADPATLEALHAGG